MGTRILEGSSTEHVDLRVITVEGDFHQHHSPLVDGRSLAELLQPITDASHTRDRKRSPPDSACLPGTRKGVIKWIVSWASSSVLAKRRHVLWVYGYAGCGKSAIAQEVSEQIHGGGRLLATFFFCRNAGDRSRIGRLPNTLASQMTASLPGTAPFILAAAKVEPQLLQTESCFSFGARLQRLVYEPFKAFAGQVSYAGYFLSSPYLIIIDGLDECDDKEGVQEFIATTLKFFAQNPYLPLRVLITSRVEQHIHSCLTTDGGVFLKDLADCCTRKDIETFMDTVFEAHIRSNPVIQAHIRQNGLWPGRASSEKLVDHIGGSFIFASTLFKFIFQGSGSPDDHLTPLDRFPLALDTDPGLDGLYLQTLARSEHLPYFTNIISTLALLATPFPVSGIAELLGIQASAVAHVLVDLQAIIQVPGTDDAPVTFYHTSLRDFLTTESRSERFFVPPSFHAHLLIRCLSCSLGVRRETPKLQFEPTKQTAAARYSLERAEGAHWNRRSRFFSLSNLEKLLHLRRETIELLPDDGKADGLNNVAASLCRRFELDGLTSTIEEAVSLQREALNLRPHPHPDRHLSLSNTAIAIQILFERTRCISHIEEALSMHCEALSLRPHPHPDRHSSLSNIGESLHRLFRYNRNVSHIEEAILMHREALSLRPHPHPDRHHSLTSIGLAIQSLFEHTRCHSHIEEAISMHREALDLHPHPHPDRSTFLNNLGGALQWLFEHNQCVSHIEEAILMHREALSLCPHPHPDRPISLNNLGSALGSLFGRSQRVSHAEEAISMHREALSLRPRPHPDRSTFLNNLGSALQWLFEHNRRVSHIEEAISMHREALSLRPHPHPDRHRSLTSIGVTIQSLFEHTRRVSHVEEAISMHREALSLLPHPHPDRSSSLNNLGKALQSLFTHNRCVSHIEEAIRMHREAVSLRPHPHPYRPYPLGHLGSALYKFFKEAGSVENLDEAISLRREALSYRLALPYPLPFTLRGLVESLGCRYDKSGSLADLDEAIGYARELVVEHYLEGHERRETALDKLQSLLKLRFEATGDRDDLEEIEKWKNMSRK